MRHRCFRAVPVFGRNLNSCRKQNHQSSAKPIHRSAPCTPRPRFASTGGHVTRTAGRVLVADDYEPNLQGLRQLLEDANYSVVTATNGSQALEKVATERPDVVLLDVVMPGLSGVDVCAEVKRNASTCLTPVVLISGAQENGTRLAGLDAGADDFLRKPIDTEELYARVRSLMRLKRLTSDLDSAETLFLTLARVIEARDPYTEGHCDRLAACATTLGRHLGLEPSDLDALRR